MAGCCTISDPTAKVSTAKVSIHLEEYRSDFDGVRMMKVENLILLFRLVFPSSGGQLGDFWKTLNQAMPRQHLPFSQSFSFLRVS